MGLLDTDFWGTESRGDEDSLTDQDSFNYESQDFNPRFLFVNTSGTITVGQALALILGISALLGTALLAAYFFAFGQGNNQESYGYGGGGYSSGGSYSTGGGYNRRKSKRSADKFTAENEDEMLVQLMSLVERMMEQDEETLEDCKRLSICKKISNPRYLRMTEIPLNDIETDVANKIKTQDINMKRLLEAAKIGLFEGNSACSRERLDVGVNVKCQKNH